MNLKSNCDEDEELIQQCFEVLRSDPARAGVSILQRRLRLGYTRAARIMDELEFRGLVGPARGFEARQILKAIYEVNPKPASDGNITEPNPNPCAGSDADNGEIGRTILKE